MKQPFYTDKGIIFMPFYPACASTIVTFDEITHKYSYSSYFMLLYPMIHFHLNYFFHLVQGGQFWVRVIKLTVRYYGQIFICRNLSLQQAPSKRHRRLQW